MADYEIDRISLLDDDGVEYEFEILDVINENGRKFYALSPMVDDENQFIEDSGEYYIMEEIIEEDEEGPILADIEDEELLDHLAEIFESHFDEMFDYGDVEEVE